MAKKVYSYVRFSSPEQRKGDSMRRQLKLAEDWAKDNGLILDDRLRFQDLGLSGYSGANRTRGELNAFLELIKSGSIATGSILLVENLDRLSREQIIDALELFLSIIRAGVKIVTLADRMEYDRDSINENMMQLMMSLVILSRGHEESLTKSKRIKAAWANKRSAIDKKKLTGRCPAWLKLSEDKTKFDISPERADVIKRIFEMKLSGIGVHSIVKILNKEANWLPPRSSNGWRESYVQKILRMRAVIGEFQPKVTAKDSKNGYTKTIPEGDTIPNYFPQVISDDLFYSVQAQLQQNQKKGGRNGAISNLFGHIAKCGYCGSSMQFINKGPSPKGGTYLLCDKARVGAGCVRYLVRYPEFEDLMLDWCKGLNAQSILPDPAKIDLEFNELKKQLEGIRGKLVEITEKIDNLTNTIATTKDSRVRERIENLMSVCLDEQERMIAEEKKIALRMDKLIRQNEATNDQLLEIKAAIKPDFDQNYLENRIKLRSLLRQLIETITIYPVGIKRKVFQDLMDALDPDLANKISDKINAGNYDNKQDQTYVVKFKTGSWRKIQPGQPSPVTADYDHVSKKTISIIWDSDGCPVVDVEVDSEVNKNGEKSDKDHNISELNAI